MRAGSSPFRVLVTGVAAVCTALWWVTPPPVGALPGDFDYAIERVTIDGNVFGPHDGTPDVVEEAWTRHGTPEHPEAIWGFDIPFGRLLGNSGDINGAMHLFSPGTLIDFPQLGLSLVMSDVLSRSPLIRDAAGDARVEVVWQAATLGLNHFVHATFSCSGPGGPGVYAGLEYSYFDEFVAAAQLSPAIPGIAMSSHLVEGDLEGAIGQSLSVAPGSVGGAFVLALDYDDTAKTLTPSFSLDGGATFTGGFDPLPIRAFDGSGVGAGILIIGADPRVPDETPTPDCPSYLNGQTVSVSRRRDGSATVSFRGRGWLDSGSGVAFDPVSEGAQLVITDLAGPTVVAQLSGATAVPPGGPGTGCDPRDGWTLTGYSRFKYRNYSNAFPPDCVFGSANGLTRMTVKRRSISMWNIDVAATVKLPTAPASVTGPMYSTFVRGLGGNEDQAGHCLALHSGDTPCTARGSRVRCKY